MEPRVRLDLNAMGIGTIQVDGVDLSSRVMKAEIVAEAGHPTIVRLDLVQPTIAAELGVEVGGVVVNQVPEFDPINEVDGHYLKNALNGRTEILIPVIGRVFCRDWRSLKSMLDWCRDYGRVWSAGVVAGGFEVRVELLDDEVIVGSRVFMRDDLPG